MNQSLTCSLTNSSSSSGTPMNRALSLADGTCPSSATKSPPPCGTTRSRMSSFSRRKRSSIAVTARGVKALDTERRSRVCVGGSTLATKLDRKDPWSPSTFLVSAARLREIVSDPSEENRLASPYAARTSSWRVRTYASRCSLWKTGRSCLSLRRKSYGEATCQSEVTSKSVAVAGEVFCMITTWG